MSSLTLPASDWLPGPDAARILGLGSARTVRRLAERGLITVREIPGSHPRYARRDLVALAEASTRPATGRKGA
jgi:hypothetical protein